MSKKHTYEYIKTYFENNGCLLLSEQYIDTMTPLKYLCKCGNTSTIIFNSFRKGHRCGICGGTKKLTFEYVYNYFKENKCELLEKEYKNNRILMKYICDCGNISQITFRDFKTGRRCKKCCYSKYSGEKHPNYNPNLTDKERTYRRSKFDSFEYKKWRKEVYERDGYLCQKCHQKDMRLNSHHIKNYINNKDLRFIVSNGITLCKKCHIEFHHIYGNKNNNQQQLDEFLANIGNIAKTM